MQKMCKSQGCHFSQMDREPERWAMDGADDATVELRFATIGMCSRPLAVSEAKTWLMLYSVRL